HERKPLLVDVERQEVALVRRVEELCAFAERQRTRGTDVEAGGQVSQYPCPPGITASERSDQARPRTGASGSAPMTTNCFDASAQDPTVRKTRSPPTTATAPAVPPPQRDDEISMA